MNELKTKYPEKCVTLFEKLEYACRTQELLRLKHNEEGQKVKDGILTLTEFREFQERHDEQSEIVMQDIFELTEELKIQKTYDKDIDVKKLIEKKEK